MIRNHLVIICLAILSTASPAPAEDAATRGYRWLRTRPYLPADFDRRLMLRCTFEAISAYGMHPC